jgi:hypothetical protein
MMQSLVFVIYFFLLGMLTYYIRQRYIREGYCPTATGSCVMALCVFAVGVMKFFPPQAHWLIPIVFLEILVVWLLITESYLKCFLEGHFYIHSRNMLNRFHIGTWVIATSFLTILADKAFPEWYEIIWLLGLVSVCVWIEYAHLFLQDLFSVSRRRVNLRINGSIFLGCMSFQCMVLLLNTLLPDDFPIQMSVLFLILGYLFYLWSFALLLRSFSRNRSHHFLIDWSYVNSYIYGGLAISGLAALKIGIVPAPVIVSTCVAAMVLFVLIESINVCKYFYFRKMNTDKVYDATQWAQVLAPFQMPYLKHVIHFVTHYCQYAILILMLWNVGVFFKFNVKQPLKKPAPLSLKNQE